MIMSLYNSLEKMSLFDIESKYERRIYYIVTKTIKET